jgi:hypothetical protein
MRRVFARAGGLPFVSGVALERNATNDADGTSADKVSTVGTFVPARRS